MREMASKSPHFKCSSSCYVNIRSGLSLLAATLAAAVSSNEGEIKQCR